MRSRLSKHHLTLPPHISSKRYPPEGRRTSCPFAPALFDDLRRFVGMQMVYLASSLRPALASESLSSADVLRDLVHQLRPPSAQVEVSGVQALAAGVELVRRSDFDPAHTLNVR